MDRAKAAASNWADVMSVVTTSIVLTSPNAARGTSTPILMMSLFWACFALSIADGDTSIIANPIYSWMYIYIFDVDNTFRDYLDVLYYPIQTEKIVVVSDNHLENDLGIGEKLRQVHSDTRPVRTFKGDVLNYDLGQYPYTSTNKNYEGSRIEVRTN